MVIRAIALSSAAWFALIGSVRAQDTVDVLPPQYTNAPPEQWLSQAEKEKLLWWRERVEERFREQLVAGEYPAVLNALGAEFRAQAKEGATELTQRFQQQMDVVIAKFDEAFAAAKVSRDPDDTAKRAAINEKLNADGIGVQSLEPQWLAPNGAMISLLYYFPTDNDLGIATAETTSDGKYKLLVPPNELRNVRLIEDAFRFVLGHFIAPVQHAQFEALLKADKMWTGYLFEGYSQYPWEALLNGWWLDFKTFEPPEHQWIVAHPSVAFEVSTTSLDEMQGDGVLAIELFGYLQYYDENQEFYGAALTATLQDSLSPGLGVLAHWSNKISLGITWHDLDDDNHYLDEDPYLLLSVDLFGYVQSQAPAFREKYETVRGLLGR